MGEGGGSQSFDGFRQRKGVKGGGIRELGIRKGNRMDNPFGTGRRIWIGVKG